MILGILKEESGYSGSLGDTSRDSEYWFCQELFPVVWKYFNMLTTSIIIHIPYLYLSMRNLQHFTFHMYRPWRTGNILLPLYLVKGLAHHIDESIFVEVMGD